MNISVIICTHNPRADYLRRTIEGLRLQTLPREQWEFLLVDNASAEPLAGSVDLSWHPNGRHVLETELGLTPARLRGISEAKGELLVFVDDDNVLERDYLQAARELFAQRPDLGVASGRLLPEYESAPPAWFAPYESWIAVRRLERSRYSNFADAQSEPCGAGMCLRRDVAEAFRKRVTEKSAQLVLGRRGASLLSGEDVMIARVALALGYAIGQFVELNALHLIPARRVSEKYLLSLYCHIQASGRLIGWLENPASGAPGWPNWREWLKWALRLVKGGGVQRRLVVEEFRALNLARRVAKESTPRPPALNTVSLQKA